MKEWVGKTFGTLKVLERADDYVSPSGKKSPRYKCECRSCGKEITVIASLLKHYKSCGCLHNTDLTGQQFGRLTVIRKTGEKSKKNSYIWECLCECGNTVYIPTQNLKSGETQSCGCIHLDTATAHTSVMREKNLKMGTNLGNISKNSVSIKNTSGIRGVSWNKNEKKWHARIQVQKKSIRLGYFDNIEDAAVARKAAEEKYFAPLIEEAKKLNHETED